MFRCCFSFKSESKSKSEPEPAKKGLFQLTSFMNSFRGSTTHLEIKPIQCKVCDRELKSGEICHCLKTNPHPTEKETKEKIQEQYLQKSEIVKQIAHIEKNPEQLIHLVNDIYDIVEHSSLHDDLTPTSMAKVKDNLVNEICVHLEDYVI